MRNLYQKLEPREEDSFIPREETELLTKSVSQWPWHVIYWICVTIAIAEAILLSIPLSVEHSVKPPASQFDHVQVAFTNEESFSRIRDMEDLQIAWSIYTLPGYVKVTDPQAYAMVSYVDPITPEENIFVPSVFHQLSCLKDVQTLFVELQKGKTALQMTQSETSHTEDCFDYLRQGIMCGGDMTLGTQMTDESTIASVKHDCRDWGQIMEWQRRYSVASHGG
ncbi:hypothetical protein ETB97_003540 [Aspergillus alliaceus]|uniref:Uncharacterized protein n=1 Tax=Petromyces alliaceus TaxID=209559 RepID=A0A8H5ZZX9_PETAA|nr:hypothetical protein ETB97_003540 [Aspergillus burnettii]